MRPFKRVSRRLDVARFSAVLLLAASLLVIHWPVQKMEFTQDDQKFIVENQSIVSVSLSLGAFSQAFPPGASERGLYRPLTNLSYAVDRLVWGPEARGARFSNLLIYLLILVATFQLLRRYFSSWWAAFTGTALFALHPVHAEVVDSAAGRSELLMLLFALVALLTYLRSLQPAGSLSKVAVVRGWWSWSLASALALALSCFSKESGLVILPLLLVHGLVFPAPPADSRWQRMTRLLPQLLVGASYLAIRVAVLGRFGPDLDVFAGLGPLEKLWTVGAVFSEYLRLLFWPNLLQVDSYYQHAIGLVRQSSPVVWFGLSAMAGALGVFVYSFAQVVRDRTAPRSPDAEGTLPVLVCSLAIFLGFLVPVSHLIGFGALMAERFLFAPSLGFVSLLVLIGRNWSRRLFRSSRVRYGAVAVCVLIILLPATIRSHQRALDWTDNLTLWSSETRVSSPYAVAYYNLGNAYLNLKRWPEARAAYSRAIELNPKEFNAMFNLAFLAQQQGDLKAAAFWYGKVLEVTPADTEAMLNLALVEVERYRYSRALELYRQILKVNPGRQDVAREVDPIMRAIAAKKAFLLNNRDLAKVSKDPDLLEEMAKASAATGDDEGARYYAAQALKLRSGKQKSAE